MQRIADADRRELIALARDAISRALRGDVPPDVPPSLADMTTPCAAFVTLRDPAGRLRGCRGEVPARQPLPECVRHVAVASAVDDPRFEPVELEEFPGLTIEISALTEPRPLRPADVEVGRHGLMISGRRGAGLLLPQVPLAQGWNREEFLDGVSVKAGLPPGAWRDEDTVLLGFEAEVWGEEPWNDGALTTGGRSVG